MGWHLWPVDRVSVSTGCTHHRITALEACLSVEVRRPAPQPLFQLASSRLAPPSPPPCPPSPPAAALAACRSACSSRSQRSTRPSSCATGKEEAAGRLVHAVRGPASVGEALGAQQHRATAPHRPPLAWPCCSSGIASARSNTRSSPPATYMTWEGQDSRPSKMWVACAGREVGGERGRGWRGEVERGGLLGAHAGARCARRRHGARSRSRRLQPRT